MLRCTLWLLALCLLPMLCGCYACSSCHDYDPPVANSPYCSCAPGQRAGSAMGGAIQQGQPVPEEFVGEEVVGEEGFGEEGFGEEAIGEDVIFGQ